MPTDQMASRRIVGVEEHFLLPDLLARIPKKAAEARGYFSRDQPYAGFSQVAKLTEVGNDRIKALDEAGVSLQVLSLDGPAPTCCRHVRAWPGRARPTMCSPA